MCKYSSSYSINCFRYIRNHGIIVFPAVDISSSSISSTDTTVLATDSPEVARLKRELYRAQLIIQVHEEMRRKLLLGKYGPSSEKLSDDQLRLLELEPGVSNQEVEAEAGRDQQELEHRPKREGSRDQVILFQISREIFPPLCPLST